MTDGPPVTITDPRAGPPLPPAPRPRWVTRARAQALLTAVVLLVALASAGHLGAGKASGLVARSSGYDVFLGSPAVVRLEVVLHGDPLLVLNVGDLRPDAGWTVAEPLLPALADGVRLRLVHPVVCEAHQQLPSRVLLDTADGRTLRIPVQLRPADHAVSLCDPLTGPAAVRVVTSTLTTGARTLVRLGIVDASTRPVTLSAVAFPGFSFAATRPLPLVLGGRDRHRALSLRELPVSRLDLIAAVTACSRAEQALRVAAAARTPNLLSTTLAGRPASLDVPGLEAYLDVQWRATCVR